MKEVFVAADNIFSPIGFTSKENFSAVKKNQSGISRHENPELSVIPFYASLFSGDSVFVGNNNTFFYTKFEQLLIASISDALQNTDIDIRDRKTVLIISSTKGNINLIEKEKFSEELKNRVALHESARLVADHFQ